MRRRAYPFLILTGDLLVVLGFILPWYASGAFYGESANTSISGLQLWLRAPSAGLTYVPRVVPEFFALLWIMPVAVLGIGACCVGELFFPQRNDRWLSWAVYLTLLILMGIFLWPALMQASVQFGLGICIVGWLLTAFGVLLEFKRNISDSLTGKIVRAASTRPSRRTVLRGLVGMVGLASLAGTGGFLLWKTVRMHAAITTYRYRNPVTGQISSGGAPDFNAVLTVEWSPDGKRVLVAQLHAPPQSWDAFTGERIQTYQPAEAVSAAWSPKGQQIALSQRSYPEQPFLAVVNARTDAQEAHLSLENSQMNGLARFAWSPDGAYLALADAVALKIRLWNPTNGAFGATFTIPSPDQSGLNRVQDLAWSPDGAYLATTIPESLMLPDGTFPPGGSLTTAGLSGVYVWNVQSGMLLLHQPAEVPSYTDGGPLLSWAPNGQRFAFANKTMVQILDLALQKPVLTYTGHVLVPTALTWSPGGKYLASGSADWTVQVWEAATGTRRFLYQGHNAVVFAVDWSPYGTYLVSGSGDGTAQVWQPEL